MTDEHCATDPVVQELRCLQPQDLSAGFMDSLGQRLEMSSSDGRSLRQRNMTRVVASLAAVAVLIFATHWSARDLPTHDDLAPSTHEFASPAGAPEEDKADEAPEPTLVAYSQMMSSAQGELEALLDYHARTLLPTVADSRFLSTARAVAPMLD